LSESGEAGESFVFRRRRPAVRRVLIAVSILVALAATGVSGALSKTRSTPTLPALKLKGNLARGKRVFIGRGDCIRVTT